MNNSVLRCPQCNKPFDKEPALKRHGYYCRLKKGTTITRVRSCDSCAKAKARCDTLQPKCSRCAKKSIDCNYPITKSAGPRWRGPRINRVIIDHESVIPPVVSNPLPTQESHGVHNSSATSLEEILSVPEQHLPSQEQAYFDWLNMDIGFHEFMTSPMNTSMAFPSPVVTPNLERTEQPSEDQIIQRNQAFMLQNFPIPPSPTLQVRSLVPKSRPQKGAQRITNLMLSTLRSYPQMMLSENDPHPLIHAHFLAIDDDNENIESLANCISLVHMISKGKRASRKLFWKNVGLECERIGAKSSKMNKWELLVSMQALCIYIIMRLSEGETNDNNLDFLINSSIVKVAQQITCVDIACNTPEANCSYNGSLSWEDWIYEESRRRLTIVMRILGMLVYFEPVNMCTLQSDLAIAPLSSRKQLWESGSKDKWQTEVRRDARAMTMFALAASGDLVKLDTKPNHCADTLLSYKVSRDNGKQQRGEANWEEWLSGTDGFGGLVMLAASLLE